MSDFYAKNPVERESGKEDFLDKDILDIKLGAWKKYFDGAVNFEATNSMAKERKWKLFKS